jgi:TP901 family phage tail tape measure protein
MKPLTETVRIEVETPKPKGNGLAAVRRDLMAIDAYLNQINRRLSGIFEPVMVKRTAKQFQNNLASAMKQSPMGLKPGDVSKALGLDPKMFTSFVRQGRAELSKLMSGGQFRTVPMAAKAAFQFSQQQLALQRQLRSSIGDFFGGGKVSTKPTVSEVTAAGVNAKLTGQIPLEILPSQILATLGPGAVTLTVPSNQLSVISGQSGQNSKSQVQNSNSKGGGGGTRGDSKSQAPSSNLTGMGKEANELKRVVETTKRGAKTTITNAINEFETLATTYQPDGSASKKVQTERSGARQRFLDRLKLERELMSQNLAGIGGDRGSALRGKANVLKKSAASLEDLVKGSKGELAALGYGPMVEQMQERVQTLKARATSAQRAAAEAELKTLEARLASEAKGHQTRMRDEMRSKAAFGRVQEKATASRAKEDEDERKQVLREERARRKYQRDQAKAAAALESERATALKVDEGRAAMEQLRGQGFRLTDTKRGTVTRASGGQRSTESYVFSKESGGQRIGKTLTFEFDQAGKAVAASMSQTLRAMKDVRSEASAAGRDFIKNTAHVTAWFLSVSLLYKALGAAEHSLSQLVNTGYQTARLSQVFDVTRGSASALRDDILALAAANGRSTDEALDASIAWARLNLSRAQTTEAVRVALMAANVAEMTAAESTDHLQAVMAAYQLRVGQLGTVLGELNQISNTYNVTNKNMLLGISKTAAVAKQAGIPLAELMAIIGGTVGITGQSGAAIGTALKSMTIALSNPEIQKFLRQEFQLEVTTRGGGEIKDMSQLLSDLFATYQQLTNAERQHLLFQVAGKTQASRMQAVLDGYIRSQVLAINAQLNLSSAQRENEKITATLKAQLQGLVTQWDLFVTKAAGGAPMAAMSGVAKAFRNALSLGSTNAGATATQGMALLFTALTARLLVTQVRMAEVGKAGNFLSNTLARAKTVGQGTAESLKSIWSGLYAVDTSANVFSRSLARGIVWLDNYGKRLVMLGKLRVGLGSEAVKSRAAAKGMAVGDSVAAGAGTAAMGGTLRLLAGLGAILRMMGPTLVVIGSLALVTTAWNKSMEMLGRSSDTVLENLDKMNRTAEGYRTAAEAYAQTARLLDTIKRSLPNMRSEQEKLKAVEKLQDVGFSAQQQRALEVAIKLNDQTTVNRVLEEQRNRVVQQSLEKRQQEFVEIQKQRAEIQKRMDELEARPGTADKTHRADLEAKMAELNGRKVRLQLEEAEELSQAYNAWLDTDQRHQINLERQKSLLESIAEIYRTFPTLGQTARVDAETASLRAQQLADEARKAQLLQQDKLDTETQVMQRERGSELDKKIQEQRAELAAINRQIEGALTGGSMEGAPAVVPGNLTRQQGELQRAIAVSESLKNQMGDMELSPDAQRRKAERKELEKRLQGYGVALAGQEDKRSAAALIDRGNAAREYETHFAEGSGAGRDEAERALNRRQALEARRKELEGTLDKWGNTNTVSVFETRNRLAQIYLELSKSALEINRMQNNLTKEEIDLIHQKQRAYEASLMTSGPEQLLKKLAAARLNQRGVTAGEFFSLSSDMRKELQDLPDSPFDPEMQKIRGQRRRLGPAGSPDEYIAEQARIAAAAGKNLPDLPFRQNGGASTSGLAEAGRTALEFAANVRLAGRALAIVPGLVDQIALAVGRIPVREVAGAPVLPQARGHALGEG